MDNKNQKQFAGGTVGKGKKYTLHIDEYMQAMAIARTFFKPAEREGFLGRISYRIISRLYDVFSKQERRTPVC
ncbi:hypothetical protein P4G91_08645 [Bacillus cereus]|nr:hypothetical protein [Bacillus cereus]